MYTLLSQAASTMHTETEHELNQVDSSAAEV